MFFSTKGTNFVSGAGQGQPEIVDEIWPEVQPLGRTGRLNCTIAKLGTNQVGKLIDIN